ncbi:unnamed protein product [Prorocentrum cordatum]|uniref:Dioxygenase n=1 Tax=Prorocentrum cordatum TaxID=2364126 RepID=A0ABN9UTS3_9DINO|nr:unnamed protein product [Polarella glacialis]
MTIVAAACKGGLATTVAVTAIFVGVWKGPRNSISLELIDIIDGLLDWQQGSLTYNLEESVYFKGIFAPTQDEVNDGLGLQLELVEGSLPRDLDGLFLRIGPNLWAEPTKRHHVFDGDGMVHTVRIKNGSAFYHNAWMRTPRLAFEQERGQAYFGRIGELTGLTGILKAVLVHKRKVTLAGLDLDQAGLANVAMAMLPDGRLWALADGNPAFEFRVNADGVISTVGYNTTFKGRLSAHPKIDARSGEAFFHVSIVDGGEDGRTFLAFRRLDEHGRVQVTIPLNTSGPSFNHDPILSESYLIVLDTSVRFTPEKIAVGGGIFTFDSNYTSRVALIPRSARTAAEVRWFDLPQSIAWVHGLHAWEEDGGQTLKLWAPLGFESDAQEKGKVLDGCCDKWYMAEVRLDLRPGGEAARITVVDPEGLHNGEFTRLRDDLAGAGPARFGYTAAQMENSTADFGFNGFTKWDMEGSKVSGEFRVPDGWLSGEPVFIPSSSPSGDPSDDGFIGNFLYGPHPDSTDFAIWDARIFSGKPVARLRVPKRVPVGFHGAWLTAGQLSSHLARHDER